MSTIQPAQGSIKILDKATKPITAIITSLGNLAKSALSSNASLNKTQSAIDGIAKAQNRLGRVSANMKKQTNDITSQALGVVALGLSFKSALDPAIKFQQAMKDLEAIAFGTADSTVDVTGNMAKMAAQAKHLGAVTAFSSVQAAEAQIFLAKAGFKTNEILEAMPGLLSLASATGSDLGRSSDILSDLLGAFGAKTSETGRLVDVMAAATSSANVDMESLFETLKVAAPIGVAAGQSIEGIVTATALLGNAGIKGSNAATALKNSYLNLATPTSEAAKLLKTLGIKVSDAKGNMLPFEKVMLNMGKSLSKLSQVKQIKVFETVFGKEAIAGAINLEKAISGGEFEKMLANLENSAGVAEKMAKIRLDSMTGDFDNLSSAVENIAISIGLSLSPAIRSITVALTDLGEPIDKFVNDNAAMIKVIGFVSLSLVALKIATLGYIATLWLVSPAVKALSVMMGALRGVMIAFNIVAAANPLGAIILAVSALVAGVVLLIQHWDTLKDKMASVKSFFGFGPSLPEQDVGVQEELANVGASTQTINNNNVNRNEANITVNIENDKVKGVVTEGDFTTKAFINAGVQY